MGLIGDILVAGVITVMNLAQMLLAGVKNIGLSPSHRRHHYAIRRDFQTVAQRWQLIGDRLRTALGKVVAQNE